MHQHPRKVLLSWSSGKDCAYALHLLQQNPSYETVGLFTTINETSQRVAMHAIRVEILQAQADAIGLPLDIIPLPFPCSNADYEQRMQQFIQGAERRAIDCFAYGDLFLEDIRQYRIDGLRHSTIEPIFPVWELPTRSFSEQLITHGFEAFTTCVDPRVLPASYVGRVYDQGFIASLPEGIDPCGENGEFHTFVHNAPVFKHPVAVRIGETVQRDGFAFADVLFI